MLQDYKNKKVCVVDNNVFTETAVTLSEHFGETYYHTPWVEAAPTSDRRMPGYGVPGLIRQNDIDFPDFRDKIDLWVFPHLYRPGLQVQLRSEGRRVWGSATAEWLELNRDEASKHFESLGLPRGKYKMIYGIDALREYLKTHDNVYIKVSVERGDFETKRSLNYAFIEPWLNNLQHTLGAKGKIAEFMVQDKIEAIAEIGYDGFNVWGQWPDRAMVGLEIKDKGYIGNVVDYANMPKAITDFTKAIAPTLEKEKYANILSTEHRILPDKSSIMNDLCARQGSPPSELMLYMVDNWPDIMYFGAEGRLVQPEWNADWGAEVVIDSSWHDQAFWQHIQFPKEVRNQIKLHNFCVIDGEYYVLPLRESTCGVVVGKGSTMEKARDSALEACKQIVGDYLDVHETSLNDAEEEIQKLENANLDV
jgi:hypothetical protein